MLRVVLLLASISLGWSAGNVAAQTGLGLIVRDDWLGDPYLVTNPPGSALSEYRVCLVMNPALVTNLAYQAKVTALSATEVTDPNDGWLSRKLEAVQLRLKSLVGLASVSGQNAAAEADAGGSWLAGLQRWLLFSLVILFLLRRVWRFFRHVEEDDDFANHLATLATAHRWVFPVYLGLLTFVAVAEYCQFGNVLFSLAILFLASSLRRYYCEGDFAGQALAQKIHLGMSLALVWLGWLQAPENYLMSLAAWLHWPVLAWVMWAVATKVFSLFYNHPDWIEHGKAAAMFGVGLLVCGLLGGTAGFYLCQKAEIPVSPWRGALLGAILACVPLGIFLGRWGKLVAEQLAGRFFYDLLFSFGAHAEKSHRQRHLPEVLLLRHWREQGEVRKAWQTATAHLYLETRALPVWLFAMETAVLYRHDPDEALKLLKQLCAADEFHYDHRMAAVAQVQGWMATAGCCFDPEAFKVEKPVEKPTTLADKVAEKCRTGRFAEAAALLQAKLVDDPLNEPALIQLVRIYCQDLKNRPAAERLLASAKDNFSPGLLDYLNASLNEWLRLPVRGQIQRRTFFGWFRRQTVAEPPKKISLISPPISGGLAAENKADPVAAHLDRVKTAQAKMPPAPSVHHDQIELLLQSRQLGKAIELLQQQAEAQPEDFVLWSRYAEAYGLHCGNLATAEKIIRMMQSSGHFKKAQMKKVYGQLKKWRSHHPHIKANW